MKVINLTQGNDVTLHVMMLRDGEPFPIEHCEKVTVSVISAYGKRIGCQHQLAGEGMLHVPVLADKVDCGVYGVEVRGKLMDAKFRSFIGKVMEYTHETEAGETGTVTPPSADPFDVVMEVKMWQPVIPKVPARLSELVNDIHAVTDADYTHTDNNFSDEEKEKLSGLSNYDDTELTRILGNIQNDLLNFYTKTETYSRAEVNSLVSAVPKFKMEIAASLPSNPDGNTVYLVRSQDGTDGNMYTEYAYMNGKWEIIGSQAISLVNPDWDEMDEGSPAFVKNRICYYTPDKVLSDTANSEGVITSSEVIAKLSELLADTSAPMKGYEVEIEVNGVRHVSTRKYRHPYSALKGFSFPSIGKVLFFSSEADRSTLMLGGEFPDGSYTGIIRVRKKGALKKLPQEVMPDTAASKSDVSSAVNAVPQADWNENSQAAKSYVKNRPCYEIPEEVDFEGDVRDGSVVNYGYPEISYLNHLLQKAIAGTHKLFFDDLVATSIEASSVFPYKLVVELEDGTVWTATNETNSSDETFAVLRDEESNRYDGMIFVKKPAEVKRMEEKFMPASFDRLMGGQMGILNLRIEDTLPAGAAIVEEDTIPRDANAMVYVKSEQSIFRISGNNYVRKCVHPDGYISLHQTTMAGYGFVVILDGIPYRQQNLLVIDVPGKKIYTMYADRLFPLT